MAGMPHEYEESLHTALFQIHSNICPLPQSLQKSHQHLGIQFADTTNYHFGSIVSLFLYAPQNAYYICLLFHVLRCKLFQAGSIIVLFLKACTRALLCNQSHQLLLQLLHTTTMSTDLLKTKTKCIVINKVLETSYLIQLVACHCHVKKAGLGPEIIPIKLCMHTT